MSKSGDLTEEFIRDFADKLDWDILVSSQKLSENFLLEMSTKVNINFGYVFLYFKNYSEDFIRKCMYKYGFS